MRVKAKILGTKRDKTMADKLMYTPNTYTQNSIDYNKWFKSLNTKLNELTNQNSIKFSSQRIRKRYYKTLDTSVINSPMSTLS